ncbi:hypothetical protein PFISCL1PPCAC_29094, partial [Pristionchus fissidentatus]
MSGPQQTRASRTSDLPPPSTRPPPQHRSYPFRPIRLPYLSNQRSWGRRRGSKKRVEDKLKRAEVPAAEKGNAGAAPVQDSAREGSRAGSETEETITAVERKKRRNAHASSQSYKNQQHNAKCLSQRKGRYVQLVVPIELPDPKIDKQVLAGINESIADWDEQYRRDLKAKKQYTSNYIIGCVKINDFAVPDDILYKYNGYSGGSWDVGSVSVDTPQFRDFMEGLALLDSVESFIVAIVGRAAFERDYPNRYLQYEVGAGKGGYAVNEVASFRGILKALQWRFNLECDKYGIPHVWIEDWTALKPDWKSLAKVVFTVVNVISEDVQQLLSALDKNLLAHLMCESTCKTCNRSARGAGITHCCGMNASIVFDSQGIPAFAKSGKPPAKGTPTSFECTDACGCDPAKCENRLLQRGRQVRVCIFRDVRKGWIHRTLDEIPATALIGEYVGEVMLEATKGVSHNYDFNTEYPVMRADGIEKPLNICAYKKGSETRFISHSCDPNSYMETTVIGRDNLQMARAAVRAKRRI